MHASDAVVDVLKNGVYINNPTAQNVADMIIDTGKIGSKEMLLLELEQAKECTSNTCWWRNPEVLATGIVDIHGD